MKKDIYKNLKVFHFAQHIAKQFHKDKLSCLIFGNFGVQNLGDEAILTGEISELKKIPNINIEVVSKKPSDIKRLHSASSISLYNPLRIFRQMVKSDFVIVGGGGIICKPDRGLLGILYQVYTLTLNLMLPRLLGKKIYAVGLGVYANSNPFVLWFATNLLKSIELVTVRDFHSHELLKKNNVKSSIYKDNSYLMELLSKKEIMADKYFKKKYNKNNQNIGLALIQPERKSEEDHLISEIKRMIQSTDSKTHFWFYACDYQEGFNNDLLFAKKIIKIVNEDRKTNFNYSIIPTTLKPGEFFSSFTLMDYMVSMRLHSSIFSYRNIVDFTGLTYDKKCSSFLDSIGRFPIDLKNTYKKTNLLFNKI